MRRQRNVLGIVACLGLLAIGCTASSGSANDTSSVAPASSSAAPDDPTIENGRILFNMESEGTVRGAAYIDANGVQSIETGGDPTFGHAIWASPKEIVFDSERGGSRHLFRQNLGDGALVQLTNGKTNQILADLSPDGETLAFEAYGSEGDFGFFATDPVDGGTVQPLFGPADVASDPTGFVGLTEVAFSPNTKWIAFTMVLQRHGARSAIYVARPDGSELRRLTPVALHAGYPRWSPDGTTILFNQNSDGGSPLWTVPFAGGAPKALSDDSTGWASEGDWSPDGTQIVFRYYLQGWDHNELHVTNADGSGEYILWVGDGVTAETPDWGP